MLVVRLFGAPSISIEGAPARLDTRKALALLARLVMHGGRESRAILAALLWPEYDDQRARGALRRTLSALKSAVGEERLQADRNIVQTDLAGADVDVLEFRARLDQATRHEHEDAACNSCLAALTGAADLYRGDFLAGFALRDSPEFDDWQFFEAEGLRKQAAEVFERLARAYRVLGRPDQAIPHINRRLELDRLHEPSYRLLMALHAENGDRSTALRLYRECVSVLDAELGVAPLEETTVLRDAIEQGDLLPAPHAHEPPQVVSGAPHLIGRDEELRELQAAYDRPADDGIVLVIEGEAGIGKTRLAEEFLAHVSGTGAVLRTASHQAEPDLAYGAIASVVRQVDPEVSSHLESSWLAEIARLDPSVRTRHPDLPPPPPLTTPGAHNVFLEAIARYLEAALSSDAPGVIFFDDLQWADDSSLDALAYVAGRLRGRRLCLLFAWRSEDVPRGHHLRRLLADARRRGHVISIGLRRLDRDEIAELSKAVAPNAFRPELAERLYEDSEGLPLFAVEYLNALAAGILPSQTELPVGIRDLFESRLALVGERAAQALTAASVLGGSFEPDVWMATAGRSDEEMAADVDDLLRAALIREANGTYAFVHEKLRSAVYESATLARRRLLHARAADALKSLRRGDKAGAAHAAVARHYREGGRDSNAAEHYKLAGDHARSLFAHDEAAAHYRNALGLGHPMTALLHEAIGDALVRTGAYGDARTSFEAAAATLQGFDLGRLEHKLGDLYLRRGQPDLAESHLRTALDLCGENSALMARVLADLSLAAHRSGDDTAAEELAARAEVEARAAQDDAARAEAANILGMLASARGDLQAAEHHLQASLAAAASLPDAGPRVAALNNLALTHRQHGRLERALELTEQGLALCREQGDRHREAALHNNLADLLHALGRKDEAMASLKRAAPLFAQISEEGEMLPEIWRLVEW